jgi:hypothetical protein
MSTTVNNISKDFLPTIPMNFDCCVILKNKRVFTITFIYPFEQCLVILDDLRIASHKVSEVERMIQEQETRDYSQKYKHHFLEGVISTIIFFVCCCCCCKGYRAVWFKVQGMMDTKTMLERNH